MLLAQHTWQSSQQTAGRGMTPGALCSSQGLWSSLATSSAPTSDRIPHSHPPPTWLALSCVASNSAAAERLRCWDRRSKTYLVRSEQDVPSVAFHEKSIQGNRGKYAVKVSLLCQAPANTGSKRLPAPWYSASTLRQQLIQQLFDDAEKAPADFMQQLTHAWVKTGGKWSAAGILSLNQKDFLHGEWEE